ncbi:ABC-2 type transporter family protein [Prunus dulcis]|uniref:ABC-2 type transporter family protein n=1 Tax=Prunus dulcis TaxID=3755 RepID=A0A4Y1QP06_PRUDU|nr:ABC-2 type transporter family protein [Prunus dulcis]
MEIESWKPPNRYSPDIGKKSKYPIANHVSTEKLYEVLKAFVHQLSAIHIPTKVGKTLKDPKWVQAIKEEMKALEKNQTSTLETLPQGKRTVGSYGSIEHTRLVAKRYTQTYGVDYDETFAPVAKLNIIRVLLSLATNLE